MKTVFGELELVRRLAITAMFSDDRLMDKLVLKGGNALDIVLGIAKRGSLDLDFSIESDFTKDELSTLEERVRMRLEETFAASGYTVFDVVLTERPAVISDEMRDFWGGYRIEFKLIRTDKFDRLSTSIDSLRKQALVTGPRQLRKLRIEISKFEHCVGKREMDLDGYTIYVYSPEMIAIEKLRAICQQMLEYGDSVTSPSRSPRARDFFDIYTVMEHYDIDLTKCDNIELLKIVFEAKRVPLRLLKFISKYRDFHRSDFDAVKDTVKHEYELKEFDYYFEYVVDMVAGLESLWDE